MDTNENDKPKRTRQLNDALDTSALEGEALIQWNRVSAAITEIEDAFSAAENIPARMLRGLRLELVQRLKGVKKDAVANRIARQEAKIQRAQRELQLLAPIENFPLEDQR